MNVVALRSLNHDAGLGPVIDGKIARVAVYDDFASAEPAWRALEQQATLATPYQGYDFLRLWHRHIGAASGVTPCVVVAYDAKGTPLFLWPFGSRRLGSLRVVEFLGGKHANFNMAIWRRDVVAQIGVAELQRVLDRLRARTDLVMLANQPLNWAGCANPFALLPQQYSPSFGHSGALSRDYNAMFEANTSPGTRKKLRRKERLLAGHGEVRFQQAKGPAEIRAVLEDFFRQKTARTRAIGLPDVFGDDDVRQFLRAAAETSTAAGEPLIELYTLTVDGVIVATVGGIVADGRFTGMFISIVHGLYAAESPGQQILMHVVRHCCERGLHTFDLGIGEAKYKDLFCPDAEPMFDSYWPLSPAGRRAAVALRFIATAKRTIKQQPLLWSMIVKARKLRARLSGAL